MKTFRGEISAERHSMRVLQSDSQESSLIPDLGVLGDVGHGT